MAWVPSNSYINTLDQHGDDIPMTAAAKNLLYIIGHMLGGEFTLQQAYSPDLRALLISRLGGDLFGRISFFAHTSHPSLKTVLQTLLSMLYEYGAVEADRRGSPVVDEADIMAVVHNDADFRALRRFVSPHRATTG
jgi:hypothetical protein